MDRFLVLVTIYFNDKTKTETVTSLLEAIKMHNAEPNDPAIFDLDIQVWKEDDNEPA